jgi:two-component system sensor histidine kinase KdpD
MVRAAAAARAPGGSGIFRDVFRLEHPDGTTHWISATSLAVRDDGVDAATDAPAPAARRTIGVLVDVTEEHRSAEIRDSFLGILAHELRTPVTSILGAAELLERPQLDAAVRSSLTSDVASEARRLHRLVENLLILARAQRGAPIGGDEPVVLRSIVARAVAEQRRHRPGLTIEEWFEPGVPPASGDEPSVELIVRNLLSNAAKYGDPRAPIEVRVEAAPGADGGVVRLTVRDRGPGLSTEAREHMFDLFYRSSEAQRVAGGAGIGLYVVRVLVEAMRGSVHADDHPDGGARFVVELPAIDDVTID